MSRFLPLHSRYEDGPSHRFVSLISGTPLIVNMCCFPLETTGGILNSTNDSFDAAIPRTASPAFVAFPSNSYNPYRHGPFGHLEKYRRRWRLPARKRESRLTMSWICSAGYYRDKFAWYDLIEKRCVFQGHESATIKPEQFQVVVRIIAPRLFMTCVNPANSPNLFSTGTQSMVRV